jgi:hypothetical protein
VQALREYERKVIEILTKPVLPAPVLVAVTSLEPESVEHTGVGYFLTLRHPALPKERIVCDEPMLLGRSDGVETGFVVFLENNQLTLECHSWGDDQVPASYRDQDVEIVAT